MAHEILHILGSAQPEGSSIARIVCALASGLDPSRYRVHAWFLAGDGPWVGALERAGAPTGVLDWRRGAHDPVGAWRFWLRLRRLRIDIVHVHFGGRSVFYLARAATGAKIILHLHSRILEPEGLSLAAFSTRGLDAVVAASQAVASRVVDGHAQVIYAGVEPSSPGLPARSIGPHPEIVLGTAGRLIPLKGIEYLLRAAAALQGEFPGIQVEIAGTGPCRDRLERMVIQLALVGKVRFLGWVDDLNSAFRRWDIFVMPSLEEGFPIAALDAMAAGLPVVASSVGGIPELVVDGETGGLVPPSDVDALVATLRPLLRDAGRRLSMGVAARARVQEHFSVKYMTENFARLYDQLLGNTRA